MPSRLYVTFTAPFQIELWEEALPEPPPGHAQVRTLLSAVSPGTEMLVYRGQLPAGLALDEGIAALGGGTAYPLKYGYCAVGVVEALGAEVEPGWLGRRIFAFQPHESRFNAPVEALIPLPEGMTPERAVFLPNMETAVNLVMDGAPLVGERVVVLGQGIVGLLTTALLGRTPLERLVALERYPLRQEASLQAGAGACLDPDDPLTMGRLHEWMPEGADLCFELSGAPQALDTAIALTGFDGRVVIGSWYGEKRASLDLGGRFHRSRIRLISSQVSTIAPALSGRWTKARRFAVAWEMLRLIQPERLITQRIPIWEAAEAYQLIDQQPGETIQVVFTYD